MRTLAYGAISVVFAIYLASMGMKPAPIGAVISVALLSGAAFSIAAAALAERLGVRALLIGAAVLTSVAGVLLALGHSSGLAFAAAALGTISPGGQEVGPFGPIEQTAIADIDDRHISRRFAMYNLLGSMGLAVGALAISVVSSRALFWGYAAAGVVLGVIYALLPRAALASPAPQPVIGQSGSRGQRAGAVELLAVLFGVDALAGGFVVQSIIAYWLHERFGATTAALGLLFFATNVLAALSFVVAARISERIGLLNTMVFTHLPSNVLLILVPLMPTFGLAAAVLLARFAISQMDVPTRQAFTMSVVPAADRRRAAGLTNAVRPIAAAIAPALSGVALQNIASGFPFYASGGLKIAYDATLFALFRSRRKRV